MAAYFILVTMCTVYILRVMAEETYEFVNEKPDGYPNFDDNTFVKKLVQSGLPSRVKRELDETHCRDDEKLCCAQITVKTPYVIRLRNREFNVVQSEFFSQTVPDVTCKNEDKKCFKDFENLISGQHLIPKCKTVRSTINLFVQEDPKSPKLKSLDFSINIGCSCVLEKI